MAAETKLPVEGLREANPIREEILMTCAHCHGVMLKERLYDLLETDGQAYVSGWGWAYRCVTCGKVSDWLIEQKPADCG